MYNLPLFILDMICLPITVMRLILIYFYGSRYGHPKLHFFDVMLHATNKFFNQKEKTIDTVPTDIRVSINKSSYINAQQNNDIFKHTNKINHTITLKLPRSITLFEREMLQDMIPKILIEIKKNNDPDTIKNILNDIIKKEFDFINMDTDNDDKSDKSDEIDYNSDDEIDDINTSLSVCDSK